MRILFLLCFFLSFVSVSAQQPNTINGFVKDEKNNPVQHAAATLLMYPDIKSIKTTQTDSLGKYTFTNVGENKYIVLVRATGFTINQSAPFTFSEKEVTVPDIIMNRNVKQLKKVRVRK